MLRQTFIRSTPVFRSFATTRTNNGIVSGAAKFLFGEKGEKEVEKKEQQAKATLNDVNLTTGKVLADGIQGAQKTVEDVGIGADDIKKGAEAVNLKTGKILADGIQGAQDAVEDIGIGEKDIKKGAEKVNLKTGQVLADGIQKAQDAVEDVGIGADDIKRGAEKVNLKTGQVLADEIQDAQDAAKDFEIGEKDIKKGAEKANLKAGKILADGIQDAQDFTEKVDAKHEVKKNTKGYKDLQDKGRKAPIEQNRPEDLIPIIAYRSYSIAQAAKEALHKANLKLGKMAAKDIEIAEKAASEAKHSASYLNKKTGEVLAEGIDLAQAAKHRSDAVSKVRKNKLGYKTLQEKGSKVESEQCRADDGL
ncbi:hypothetical protein SBY92_000716 [Candida maltosa Xu316]